MILIVCVGKLERSGMGLMAVAEVTTAIEGKTAEASYDFSLVCLPSS
jgi:hypothetical protein